MITQIISFALIAFLAVMVALALVGVMARNTRLAKLVPAINELTPGTHQGGRITYLSEAAIGTSYLLAKYGAAATTAVVATVAGEKTFGVFTDEAPGVGAPIDVATHGGADGTRMVRAGANIAIGDELTSLANAKAQKLPAAAGTYWVFGEARTAGVDGEIVSYIPCKAYKVVVT